MSSTEIITGWVEEVAAREIMPRFGELHAGEVRAKPNPDDPDDIVTSVDLAAEAWLSQRLQELAPEALLVGEEACARRPQLLEALPGAPVAFVIDPLDGTKNFARGESDFGVMVARLEYGNTVASWIHLPVPQETYVAEQGGGAWCNGVQLGGARPGPSPLTGTLHVRHLPEAWREYVPTWFAALDEHIWPVGCAAREYVDVARGRKGFCTFNRLAPWDHLPGALLVREAGGVVYCPETGEAPRLGEDRFTVVAASPAVAERLQEIIVL